MNCAEGIEKLNTFVDQYEPAMTQDITCFSGYQNLISATKNLELLALLTSMFIHLILTPAT